MILLSFMKSVTDCSPMPVIFPTFMEFLPPCLGLKVMGTYLTLYFLFVKMTVISTLTRK